MWPSKNAELARVANALQIHSANTRPLPGIANATALNTLATQIVASLRREEYYALVQKKQIDPIKADPNSSQFDAERAVAFHMQNANVEEAAWLIFLMTHFARPASSGWLRLRDVYGMLGHGIWDWNTVCANPTAMIGWLKLNWTQIRGKFGSHRKYESLRPNSNRNFEQVLHSYLAWIGAGGQAQFFANAVRATGNNPATIFDELYSGMDVTTFGRLAKFDYLSLIGRYGVAPIKAGSAYLPGATGPGRGTRLLFKGSTTASVSDKTLQSWLDELDNDLQVGMAVLEDSLCNWQKSPASFVHFKG
ncbi:hypothetical protein GR204_06340 [Rhizobium leguminosarum]|uniref:Alpha-glutamyl/putrescinyl thymine pyrophosphorylase clade 3 domain-containing protein n=1 Tax=Rhizobium leguminosarum TaxID=384 RepID=A0A6P0B191_RHILE|nr:hypothetical protein [Rhizobium leguminosarum]MBY5846395.1 hypothetical protein [Rhizobium leguminosarum]NEI33619.1 hypothetical protein [Rhizobium leguminosarum]NEI42930.1 hypothetical protein [Rhizobium leguminosarum]